MNEVVSGVVKKIIANYCTVAMENMLIFIGIICDRFWENRPKRGI